MEVEFLNARPASAAPWGDLGAAAFLVVLPEATVLELVTAEGVVFEIARWFDRAQDRTVLDVDAAGRRALIGTGREVGVLRASLGSVSLLDLTTGDEGEVVTAPPAADDGVPRAAPYAAFDRSSGDHVLVAWTDGVTDRIERFDLAGNSTGAALVEQPASLSDPLSWVATPDGSGLVIAGSAGLQLTDIEGEALAALDERRSMHLRIKSMFRPGLGRGRLVPRLEVGWS